jgi:hypothetical protein
MVRNLTYIEARSAAEASAVLQAGLRLRATAATALNATSSRSHTIFTLTVVVHPATKGPPVSGELNLIDLAGSESLKRTGSEDARFEEARSINSSLSALGKVVMALCTGGGVGGASHVPYRDSKLTRLLKARSCSRVRTGYVASHCSTSHTG